MNIRLIKKIPIFILIFLFSFIVIVKLFGITINLTPSMREGIYIKKFGKIERGDIVAACLPEPYKSIGLENLYIQKGTKCKGADPIIKKVIAVPGDTVVLANNFIAVNNLVFGYKTKEKDSAGKVLTNYPRGKYLNSKGFWLIGVNSPNSWDSRYWGPINKEFILYNLK